jgi:hypothetical protein
MREDVGMQAHEATDTLPTVPERAGREGGAMTEPTARELLDAITDVTDCHADANAIVLTSRVEKVLAFVAEAKKRPTIGQIAVATTVERLLNGEDWEWPCSTIRVIEKEVLGE